MPAVDVLTVIPIVAGRRVRSKDAFNCGAVFEVGVGVSELEHISNPLKASTIPDPSFNVAVNANLLFQNPDIELGFIRNNLSV